MKKSKSEKDRWLEYERRKRLLLQKGLSPEEYLKEIRRLSDELGV
jgi:hypothetical protein